MSNIPAAGFDPHGRLKRTHDPRSIVYQHARMLEQLARQQKDLERESKPRVQAVADAQQMAQEKRPPGLPKEGTMNLDQLIELGRRGGRYQAPGANH